MLGDSVTPTAPMIPPPSFQTLQVPPFVRRDSVPIGGSGGQYHITGPERNIPFYTQLHGMPLHPLLANLPLQHMPFQHQSVQHAPHQSLHYTPHQHPPYQHLPFQYTQFQHADVGTTHLPWGYIYPAPPPATALHQVTMCPGVQALLVKKAVTKGEESPAVASVEATHHR